MSKAKLIAHAVNTTIYIGYVTDCEAFAFETNNTLANKVFYMCSEIKVRKITVRLN